MVIKDRPKIKVPLTDDWVLVFCKSGRRFYHNIETKRSVWFPPRDDVRKVVEGIEKDTLIKLIAHARGLGATKDNEAEPEAYPEETSHYVPQEDANSQSEKHEVSDDGVDEVNDDSAESSSDEDNEGEPKLSNSDSSDAELDNSILEEINNDEGNDEDDDMSPEEKESIFHQLLDSTPGVNPYAPWPSIMEKVVDDDRYDVYDSGKQRQEAFDNWSKKKIAQLKEQKKEGPSGIATSPEQEFLQLVSENFNSKLFYLEFKRKHRKSSAFKNSLSDKTRESLYRQFSSLMKKSEDQRKMAHKEFLGDPAIKHPQSDPRFYIAKK